MSRKGIWTGMITVALALSVMGCGAGEQRENTTATGNMESKDMPVTEQASETQALDTAAKNTEVKNTEMQNTEQAENDIVANETTYQSDYGYSMTYDAALFSMVNDEGSDYYELEGQNLDTDVIVCVTVTRLEGSVQDTVDSLKNEPEVTNVMTDSTTVGSAGYASDVVTFERSSDVGTVYETYHVVDAEGSIYLIQISNGESMDEIVGNAIENMLASFTAGEGAASSSFESQGSDEIISFATKIQEAVAGKDWAALSENISYPMIVGAQSFDTAQQFAAYDIDSLLNEEFYQGVAETDCSNLFINGEGAMFGDGQIWIGEGMDENGDSTGLKIIAINVME